MIVIGAGPAGTTAARRSARAGMRTLLVEKRAFPRDKVCGACVSARALRMLAADGVDICAADLVGEPFHELRVQRRSRTLTVPLPSGFAIRRAEFDQFLLGRAAAAGAVCMLETAAEVGHAEPGGRTVLLSDGRACQARVVIVADGLGHPSLARMPGFQSRRYGSIVGAGGTVPASTGGEGLRPGTIHMFIGDGGYVGVVDAGAAHWNVGAALSSRQIRRHGSVAASVNQILAESHQSLPGLGAASWRGTPVLHQMASRCADERLFLIGDAAGYVAPFTGEGIAAAIESAIAVMPFVLQGVESWDARLARSWTAMYARTIVRRQWVCRGLARLLQSPAAMHVGLVAGACLPGLAAWLASRVCR
ncbi:MAG: NAD(P)/FAD-dependent oxidoreductase [Pirellulaceae bacterium]